MHLIRVVATFLLVFVGCALLAACGGGSSGGSTPPASTAVPFAVDSYLITSPDTPVTGQLYASNIDNAAMTYEIETQPTHGTATLGENSGVLTYDPDSGYTGGDGLTYTAATGGASSSVANVTLLVNGDPPTVSAFGAPVYVHDGGPASVALEVRLSNPPNGQATVDYTTADGTAMASGDYTAKSGTLTFGPGVTEQTVTVNLTASAHDVSRYFFLKLSNPSSNLTLGQNLAAVVLRYYPEPLNDTGVTGCATTTNGNPSNPDSCPQSDYPAQDAEIGRDAAETAKTLVKAGSGIFGFDFTAIGPDGKPTFQQNLSKLGYTLQPWACLRDNWTGLEWEVPTPVANAGLYDTSYSYTWYDPDDSTNGGQSGTQNGGSYKMDTNSFVQAANTNKLCGHADWRLPSAAELRNLVNIGAPGTPNGPTPAIPTLPQSGLWTATSGPQGTRAVAISSIYGYDSFLPKSSFFPVILVRGGVSQ
ncbi:MAG: Calx-beta domain-containing protein [Gammaproteobacteria bacterium]